LFVVVLVLVLVVVVVLVAPIMIITFVAWDVGVTKGATITIVHFIIYIYDKPFKPIA
jgi:hypothetical protein